MEQSRRTSWVWGVGVFGLSMLCVSLWPLYDADYWWHLAVGSMIEAAHAIPTKNYFTYTLPVDVSVSMDSWLSRWWLFRIEAIWGTQGTLGLRGVLAGLTAVMLGSAIRTRSVAASAAVVLVAIWAHAGSLGPSNFGAVLVALLVLVTSRIADGELSPKWALVCAAATPLWANIDTSFWVVGAALLAAIPSVLEGRRWLVVGVLLSVALSFATPAGARVWHFALKVDPIPLAVAFLGVAYLLVRSTKIDRGLAWMCAFAAPWLGLASLIVGLVASRELWKRETMIRPVHAVAAGTFLVLAVLASPLWAHTEWVRIQLWNVRERPPLRALVPRALPVDAVARLNSWGRMERVYHSPQYAGLLSWRGQPANLLFDVPLAELRTEQLDDLRTALTHGDTWRGVFQQFAIKTVLLALPGDRELAERLAKHPDWQVVEETADYALIVHASSAGAIR